MDITKGLSELRSGLVQVFATKFHYVIIFAIICGIAITLIIGSRNTGYDLIGKIIS
jgi:hypothetical protein